MFRTTRSLSYSPMRVIFTFSLLFFICLHGASADEAHRLSRSQNNLGEEDWSQQFKLRCVLFRNDSKSSAPMELTSIPEATKLFWTSDDGNVKPMPELLMSSRMALIGRRMNQLKTTTDSQFHPKFPSRLSELDSWSTQNVLTPNVSDKNTIINLARMTSDAYYPDPSTPGWMNTTDDFNQSTRFGWQTEGLRGHVFANQDNSTVIIAFKGTSIDPRDSGTNMDKLNDNLLFSCCCATQRPDPYLYGPVCGCRTDVFQCNSTCLAQELMREDKYYVTALQVYHNVTKIYPSANIWTTGHSMGGAMASLIGLTFNIPAISFESPPQALAASRLGLAIHPDPHLTGAYHFGNTADPVFMGACHGFFSACALANLAFESQCFTGKRCVYDTVGEKGWRLSIVNHRINYVISNVLEAYEEVANCTVDEECFDCFDWYFDPK